MNLSLGALLLLCLAGIASADTRSKRRLVGVSGSADSDLERDSTTELTTTAHDAPAPSEGTTTTQPTGLQRRLRTKKGSRRTSAKTSEDSGPRHKTTRNNKKTKLMSNAKLLTRLGLARVEPGSANHYRKRLVGTQKNDLSGTPANYKGHQKRILENLDSRMYVIKLPPSSYYYASHNDYRIQDPSHKHNVNNLGINFSSNGKPSKVYHYNIPIINKVVGRKTNSNFYKYDEDINDPAFLGNGAGESSVYNVQSLEGPSNELGLPELDAKGHKKPYGKKTVTYMKPKPAKQTFTKYFSSNGKPHSFYIIQNSSTPYYHRLLP